MLASFGAMPRDERADPELWARPHWYACRTRTRSEKVAHRVLEAAGVECYLPLVERER